MLQIPEDVHADGAMLFRREVVTITEARNGTITGRAVPYNETIELLPGIRERFVPGAFAKQVEARDHHQRIKLLYSHDSTQPPLGRVVELQDRSDGLDFEAQFNRRQIDVPGSLASTVWDSIMEGDLSEFSIGFRSLTHGTDMEWSSDRSSVTLVRSKSHIGEISIVPYGAYGRSAQLTSARTEDDDSAWREAWRQRLAL